MERTPTTLALYDRPGAFWLLGGLLALGGCLAAAAAFGLLNSSEPLTPLFRLVCAFIGASGIAGGFWWARRSPGSRVVMNLARGELSIVRSGIGAGEAMTFPLSSAQAFEVEQRTDDDGGKVARPMVRLKTGEQVALSLLWSHDLSAVDAAVVELDRLCGLDPTAPAIDCANCAR